MENVMGTVRRVLSQPETPAIGLNDAALDRRSQERSIEGLSQAEGLQAIANPAPEQNIKQPRPADEAKAA
jgi:hypothetical protein